MTRVLWRVSAGIAGVAALVILIAASRVEGQSPIRGFLASRVDAERQLELRLRQIPDAEHAENSLRHLTAEPHMAGTEASHRVAEWLRAQYESYGFDAKIVSYSVWLSMPLEIKLELVAPERKPLATQEDAYDGDKDSSDPRAVIGFNAYSASGEATAPVIYVNYGAADDYRELDSMGVSVAGKIVLARYGQGYRGVKAKLAEEHKAAGLLIYSDPADDGYDAGDVYPHGPWRPMSGIQRGSILYTEEYPGDPLTPGVAATADAKRLAPANAESLPRIPAMPINARDAAEILSRMGGAKVPRRWQGGLPMTYHVGPGGAEVHLKIAMDYQQRTLYDVIAKLRGSSDGEWVVLGNHHDAWVFGAVDPGSGTSVMLETARALGELAHTGWQPRRTIVICEWDGEEPGLLGSTEWVEQNLQEIQQKAVAYINTDVGVSGPNFSPSATPSLKQLIREITREVPDPRVGLSVYDAWKEHVEHGKPESNGTARQEPVAIGNEVPVGALGAGSDFCPFFDHAGVPSMDLGFGGDYGVYHSKYDDFFWMKNFGDPTFAYHATLACVLGTLALRLDEADVLPFDYTAYAAEIQHAVDSLATEAKRNGPSELDLSALSTSAAELSKAAAQSTPALIALETSPASEAREQELNRALVSVEQAFLAPQGLAGRAWYKHTLFAPGTYEGYAATMMPGLTEAIDRKDVAAARRAAADLSDALNRATARLKEITALAHPAGTASGGARD